MASVIVRQPCEAEQPTPCASRWSAFVVMRSTAMTP
jgi:hypothetical protein